ncbi:threonine synthase-like 1 [Actinia tenebrosa]|uniref:Threonine synthase-like 1 n=1 Tax=Actinia tenebrosa TaxID=6105 RepID=A0A6P8IHN9_ACTTE|nr:threonine synthase-like 1 [Actinia tenebrosa]
MYKRTCLHIFQDFSRLKYKPVFTRRAFASSYVEHLKKRNDNIILMGSPGAGKTTVGRMVAEAMGKTSIDVDNDHLEKVWGMTVAQKLTEVGSDRFIEAEGQALLQLCCNDAVISLSGSNPMHKSAMKHVQSLGAVVYLDVDDADILGRLERMKVDRIVGQNDGSTIKDILKYRKQFYETNYDIRITCEINESPERITDKVIQGVRSMETRPCYVSTRHKPVEFKENTSFLDVVLQGLAADGGLFVPAQKIPHMTLGEWSRLTQCTYQERALRILEKWISPLDLHPSLLHQMIKKAYHTNFQHREIAPVIKLNDDCYILELFHGPTASFKDLALQLTPHFFREAVNSSKNTRKYLILVATSGDTGSAVLDGFANDSSIKVFVLYPNEGVSPIQKAQMITMDNSSVDVLGVQGDFDFCQSAIKNVFNDVSFCKRLQENFGVNLTAANSINWGRLVPQVVYHASSYLDLVKKGVISMGDKADVCIPTGNFGNILAAYYSKEMGIPFDRIICASNENNILTEFFHSGVYDMRGRNLLCTASPSIDILKSSNLERFLYHVASNDAELVTKLYNSLEENGRLQISESLRKNISCKIQSGWTAQQRCLDTIKKVSNQTGYLLDPHTAVAKDVADQFTTPNKPLIISATAHYSKFAKDVLGALGKEPVSNEPLTLMRELQRLDPRPGMHKRLGNDVRRPEIHKSICQASLEAIKTTLETFLGSDRVSLTRTNKMAGEVKLRGVDTNFDHYTGL